MGFTGKVFNEVVIEESYRCCILFPSLGFPIGFLLGRF